MKETARSATQRISGNKTHSRSVSPAKRGKDSSASVHRDPERRGHIAREEKRDPQRGVRTAGAEKRGHQQRIHVAKAESRSPQRPVHIGGVKNPGPEPRVHFAGVENRSYAAHLNDFRAELHPKPAANSLHGLFPVRRKQP